MYLNRELYGTTAEQRIETNDHKLHGYKLMKDYMAIHTMYNILFLVPYWYNCFMELFNQNCLFIA